MINDRILTHGRSPQTPEPSPEALAHCLSIFRSMLILPILNPELIEEDIKDGPDYLRWAFMALALKFSSHPFYSGVENEAIKFYGSYAQKTVDACGVESIPPTTVMHSLIFLALADIHGRPA